MSFAEQERALFDLLFDQGLRARFCTGQRAALAAYDLEQAELNDFAVIRPDALELDAKMRRNILLGHLCRVLPLSFAVVASLDGGRTVLQDLLDTQTMRSAPHERAAVFSGRLHQGLSQATFDNAAEKPMIMGIVEAELVMAMTSASLKQEILAGRQAPAPSTSMAADWSSRPIKLAAHVGAAVIPQPYSDLKRACCRAVDAELWNHLSREVLTKAERRRILQDEKPRLLVLRARVAHLSLCDPVVDHQSVELSDGFAPLLQYINGSTSVRQILEQLGQAGAPGPVQQGVESGFKTLLEVGMLEPV